MKCTINIFFLEKKGTYIVYFSKMDIEIVEHFKGTIMINNAELVMS